MRPPTITPQTRKTVSLADHSTTVRKRKCITRRTGSSTSYAPRNFTISSIRPRVHASRRVLVFRPDMSEITRDEVYPETFPLSSSSRSRISFLPFQGKKLSYSLPGKRYRDAFRRSCPPRIWWNISRGK